MQVIKCTPHHSIPCHKHKINMILMLTVHVFLSYLPFDENPQTNYKFN